MPLTWDTNEIKDYEENYPSRVVTEETKTMMEPPGTYWNSITHHLVMSSLRVGLSGITEANLEEWVRRYETSYQNDGEEPPVSREHIAGHIGLRTNVSNVQKRSWNAKEKRLMARWGAKSA